MRSASALVSSMNDPKLTMNGTRFNASATFNADGDPNTGFTSSTINTFGGASRISFSVRVGVIAPCAAKDMPPGWLFAFATWFKRLTAHA